MVVPVEVGRACDDIRVRQHWRVAVGREILARLQQQDAALRIGAQSRARTAARLALFRVREARATECSER
jgi:hypothetical protein